MKLTELAAKPKLVKILVDDEATIKEFGEPIEFWTWDRQPLEIFMKLASANQQDLGQMIEIVKKLILNEDGKEIITSDQTLPSNILIKVVEKVVTTLGKS